ncbi:MAG: MBL fold metallo-hydrolase [Planctomycetota bacterium]|jgi:glyoxylase-like metal-dependent hydrolase (beta-lactamase superfamily II)|nr:MAG: MBL fold metallo-hydrolase [Planctomycetota bacterium]
MKFTQVTKDIYLFPDICNVYVIKSGELGLLIDLGTGDVLDHLKEIGINKIEWVLFTHHHREQTQGYPRLKNTGAKVAVPEVEKALFETPMNFRKMTPALSDAFTVHGASYVRPAITPIKVDKTFAKMDDFIWQEIELWCVETAGNSPGSLSYITKKEGEWIAFTGDVMLQGSKLHTWFDTEWDYGFSKGIYALYNSLGQLEGYPLKKMLPSHGPIVENPLPQLQALRNTLREFNKLYLRGWEVSTFAGADQDRVSQPTTVPHVWQVTKHLFKFRGPEFWPNFHMILADNGHALVVDCGLFKKEFLDKSIALMKERLGLKQIDVVLVTHMHGDHCLEAPHLRDKHGAKIWTMNRVVAPVSRPLHFDYCAQVNTYGKGIDSIAFDKVFQAGDTFTWEGFKLTVDWMPGQTEFALCLHGIIDGKNVAFTGDNIFGSSSDPSQNGHEAVVARNSCILEEGYIYAAKYLKKLQPDLLLGGHSWAMAEPAKLIDRYLEDALKLKEYFEKLSFEKDYRWMYDPYWVHMEPYRVVLGKNNGAEARLVMRNFDSAPISMKVEIVLPEGFKAEPAIITTMVAGESTTSIPIQISCTKETVKGLHLAALDITRKGKRAGQLFDFILWVG